MKKEAIVFINKLIEIELNLSDNPSGEVIYSLKKQFNHILTKLKKPLIYEQNTPQDIIDVLIEKFDYPEDFATSKSQNQANYVDPRHIAMTISKVVFDGSMSLAEIGKKYFSNKDHATILHAVKVVKNKLETDVEYKKLFNLIQIEIFGYEKIKYHDL